MTIWQEVDQLRRAVDHVFAEAARPHDVTIIDMHVLLALYEHDGQHASILAKAASQPATSFTPTLDRLVSKGLVERRPDPSDARAIFIYLTTLGESLREPLTAAVIAADSAGRDVLTKWQNRQDGDR
jgi:DNA-binding MarR family transcriptional regulator